ncbi:MAG TPA: hypothetical protein VHK63_04730 [Candidatus Limnocylindria bacterium]|nr:hypothetical protein [Candidatus Limnocylindria bacterium]
MPDRSLADDLVATLEAARRAERDVFGALDPAVRDAPLREGDWSPKDHQAHLSAWKARHADRFAAARTGTELPEWEDETDVVNARLHATRVEWSWDDVAREADDVSQRLADEIRATDPELILAGEHLLSGTFGNGAYHAQEHFGWLLDARIGVDEERVSSFVDEVERTVRDSSLPDRERGAGIYNTACFHALRGRTDRARPLLREAFRIRPDLVEWARQDDDLLALSDEIDSLAAQ